jgi:hypothetical protein
MPVKLKIPTATTMIALVAATAALASPALALQGADARATAGTCEGVLGFLSCELEELHASDWCWYYSSKNQQTQGCSELPHELDP